MERIEDRSKALSYIGLEIADALKEIPAPVEENVEQEEAQVEEPVQKVKKVKKAKVAAIAQESVQDANVEQVAQKSKQKVEKVPKIERLQTTQEPQQAEQEQYVAETFEAKPSLWQRFKNSKFVRAIKYIMSIRVVLEVPALPDGKTEN